MNKYLIVGFLCFLGIFGCEKEINFNRNGFIFQKIVINCQFTPDSLWKVHLTNSSGIGSTRPIGPIENATVNVVPFNGVSIPLTHQENGLYSHPNFRPIANSIYALEAHVLDYQTVTSSNRVPLDIKASVLDTFTTDLFDSSVLQIKLGIDDPVSEDNYYIIESIVDQYDSVQFIANYRGRFYSLDNRAENREFLGEQEAHTRIFLRDDKFNGHKITTEFAAINRPLGNFSVFDPIDHVDVKIYVLSVSKELYDFLLSVDKSRLNAGIGLPVDPVPIISNIDNGFGIFGGYTQYVFEYKIQ